MEHTQTGQQAERLAKIETKVDGILTSVPEWADRRREDIRELKTEINQLQASINQLNSCMLGLTKEMQYVSNKVINDIAELEDAQKSLKSQLDGIQTKIIGWSSAASAIFLLIGPKILHIFGA